MTASKRTPAHPYRAQPNRTASARLPCAELTGSEPLNRTASARLPCFTRACAPASLPQKGGRPMGVRTTSAALTAAPSCRTEQRIKDQRLDGHPPTSPARERPHSADTRGDREDAAPHAAHGRP